jgi:hypothetical protein
MISSIQFYLGDIHVTEVDYDNMTCVVNGKPKKMKLINGRCKVYYKGEPYCMGFKPLVQNVEKFKEEI